MPGYQEISQAIAEKIKQGQLLPGSQLPTVKKLAQEYRVSVVTAQRAISTLKEQGIVVTTWGEGTYVATPSAQQIVSHMVSLVISRMHPATVNPSIEMYWNQLFSRTIIGVQDEAIQKKIQNQNIFINESLLSDKIKLKDYLHQQIQQIDGALCLWQETTPTLADNIQEALGCPVIFDNTPGFLTQHNCVQIDMYTNARRVMEHLISLDHQRIACIAGNTRENPYYYSRFAGYKDLLEEQHIPLEDSLIFACEENEACMQEVSQAVLGMPKKGRPTAVFCFNDFRAQVLLNMAQAKKIKVPDELAIIGFDGSQTAIQAGISTIQFPSYYLGRMAVKLLETIVSGVMTPPVQEKISSGVIAGWTTTGRKE